MGATDDDPWRAPPQNVEAETAVLGACLLHNEVYWRLSDSLSAEDFFEPVHGRIWEAIARLAGEGRIANPVTLAPFFEREEGLADVGGGRYLAGLAAAATTVVNAEDYARAVRDLALRRAVIVAAEEIRAEAWDAEIGADAEGMIAAAEERLFAVGEGIDSGGPVAMERLAPMGAERARWRRGEGLIGLGTGLADLDRLTSGLVAPDLIVLAGRPSMGKSALAGGMARAIAGSPAAGPAGGLSVEPLRGVLFFSLEMSADQLTDRWLAAEARLPLAAIRHGRLDGPAQAGLDDAARRLAPLPLYVDDTPAISVSRMRARARRLARRLGRTATPLGLVVVDYLQLCRASDTARRKASTVAEVSEISAGLKALAKDLEVPVLALSQLSRAVEQRDDKRPQLSDLRESGAIEQDADIVMFVYREEYYVQRRKPRPGRQESEMADWEADMAEARGIAEIIVAKQRQGPVGTARAAFITADGGPRFADLARNEGVDEGPDEGGGL